jgi:hypothetical protein
MRIVGGIVGGESRLLAANVFRMMVARDGVEPPTPAFSVLRYLVFNNLSDSRRPPKSLRKPERYVHRGLKSCAGKW